jgi:hypothetical protein
MKGKIIYKSSKEVFKFAEAIEEYSGDGLDIDEIKTLISKKV